jgi:hypothetical protein
MLLSCYPKNVNLGTWAYFVKEIHHIPIRLCGIHINIYESPYVSMSLFYCLAIDVGTLINEIGPFILACISRDSH